MLIFRCGPPGAELKTRYLVLSLFPVAVSLKVRPDAERPWMHLGLLSLLFLISTLEQISQVHNGGIMNVSVTLKTSSLRALSVSTTQQLQKQTSPAAPLTALNGF